MDIKEWKKELSEVLKEHRDVDKEFTGRVEINFSAGGISKVYVFKELK